MSIETSEEKTPRIDTSVQEAIWLLGTVAAVALTVFGVGMTAGILGA